MSTKDTGETKTDVAGTTNTTQTDTSEVPNPYYPYTEYDPAYYSVVSNYPYFSYYPEGIPPMMYPMPQPIPPPQPDDNYEGGRNDSASSAAMPPEPPPMMPQYFPYVLSYYDGPPPPPPPYDYENTTNQLTGSPNSRRYSFDNNKSTPRVKPSTPSSRPIKKLNLPGINDFNPRDYNQRDIPTNPTMVKGFIVHVTDIGVIINSFNNKCWIVENTSDLHILEDAFKRIGERGPIYLFYHVIGQDCLCGMARMTNRSNNRNDYNRNKDQQQPIPDALSVSSSSTATTTALSPSSPSISSIATSPSSTTNNNNVNTNNATNINNNKIPVEWLYGKNIPIKKIEEILPSNLSKQFNLISSPNYYEMTYEYVKKLLEIFSTFEHETSFLDI